MKNQNKLLKLLSIVVILYAVANVIIGFAGTESEILTPFLAISFGIYIFAHGTIRYGLKNILVLIGTGMVISLFYEALSIATGFPYSGYHYTELLGPQLLGFPIIVMVSYGIIAYTHWAVAEAVTGNFNNKLKGANIVLTPLIAAVLFTLWDYAFDPILATINKAYIWDDHGAYFGIPFANFMGWFLATYTIFQIFALIMSRQKEREVPTIAKKKVYWYQAIIMYSSIFIQLPILMMFEKNREIIIASGQVFQTNDIYQSMTLVGIAAIVVPAIIAFAVVYNSKELE
jgi:uncharacterized membrane protein